jgi:predicted metalloprotease with PDZ domain
MKKPNKVYRADLRSQLKKYNAGEMDALDLDWFIVSGQDEKKARYKVYRYLKQKRQQVQLTDIRLVRSPVNDYLRSRLKKCVIPGHELQDFIKKISVPRPAHQNKRYNLNQEAKKAGLKVAGKYIVKVPHDQEPTDLIKKLQNNKYSIQLTIN